MSLLYFLGLILLVAVGYFFGRSRATVAAQKETLHSRPNYHGAFVAILALIPMLLIFVVGRPFADYVVNTQALTTYDPAILNDELRRGAALRDIISVARGQYSGTPTLALKSAADVYASLSSWANTLVVGAGWIFGLLGISFGLRTLSANFRARNQVERVVKVVLFLSACVAVMTTIGILLSVLFETVLFFKKISPIDFLFGLQWSPQIAMRADQGGSSGAFGIVPLVTGTLLITFIAMLIAGPIGLFAASHIPPCRSPRTGRSARRSTWR